MPAPDQPHLRRVLSAAAVVLAVGVGAMTLAEGFSSHWFVRLVQGMAVFGLGAALVLGAIGLVIVGMAGWRSSDREFERIVERSEELASWPYIELNDEDVGLPVQYDDDELGDDYGAQQLEVAGSDPYFDALLRAAIDELPPEFMRALEHVAVVVSDGGATAGPLRNGRPTGAYGLYQGDTIAHDHFTERIVIYRDTMIRDFGYDRRLLALQVHRVLRHELAHHLGWDERGVRGLGL
jgi:predicted Zn-dependent protease with MMP-like domain